MSRFQTLSVSRKTKKAENLWAGLETLTSIIEPKLYLHLVMESGEGKECCGAARSQEEEECWLRRLTAMERHASNSMF